MLPVIDVAHPGAPRPVLVDGDVVEALRRFLERSETTRICVFYRANKNPPKPQNSLKKHLLVDRKMALVVQDHTAEGHSVANLLCDTLFLGTSEQNGRRGQETGDDPRGQRHLKEIDLLW